MKMVGHEAIGEGFGNGRYVLPVFLEKVTVVLRLAKHVFEPVGMVKNVIAGIGL